MGLGASLQRRGAYKPQGVTTVSIHLLEPTQSSWQEPEEAQEKRWRMSPYKHDARVCQGLPGTAACHGANTGSACPCELRTGRGYTLGQSRLPWRDQPTAMLQSHKPPLNTMEPDLSKSINSFSLIVLDAAREIHNQMMWVRLDVTLESNCGTNSNIQGQRQC